VYRERLLDVADDKHVYASQKSQLLRKSSKEYAVPEHTKILSISDPWYPKTSLGISSSAVHCTLLSETNRPMRMYDTTGFHSDTFRGRCRAAGNRRFMALRLVFRTNETTLTELARPVAAARITPVGSNNNGMISRSQTSCAVARSE
jgi:hypothetical protein